MDLIAQGDISVRGGAGASVTGAVNTRQTTTETRTKGQAFLFGLHDGAEGWGAKSTGTSTQAQGELCARR